MAESIPPTPPEAQPPVAPEELFGRRRAMLFLGVFVVELVIMILGMFTPIGDSTRQGIVNQTSGQFGWLDTAAPAQVAYFIFAHNLGIALVEMVPVLGAFFFVISVYTTGLATQAIVVSASHPSSFGLVLFAFPYSLVELSAYAIAMASGTMVLVAWRRKRLVREVKAFMIEIGLVAAVLLVAATMETVTIRYSILAGLALWLPTGAAVAGLIILFTRKPRQP